MFPIIMQKDNNAKDHEDGHLFGNNVIKDGDDKANEDGHIQYSTVYRSENNVNNKDDNDLKLKKISSFVTLIMAITVC